MHNPFLRFHLAYKITELLLSTLRLLHILKPPIQHMGLCKRFLPIRSTKEALVELWYNTRTFRKCKTEARPP